MPHQPPRFAIFRDAQLVERDHGDDHTAKARLEKFAHLAPDHKWWYVVYDEDQLFAEEDHIETAAPQSKPHRWIH